MMNSNLRQIAPPSMRYQQIRSYLYQEISCFLTTYQYNVLTAPFDVRLPHSQLDKPETIVQPEICIVRDRNKLDERGCTGAPDLVIEILSSGNSKHALREKYDLYQEVGITEYWTIYPSVQVLQRYILDDTGIYKAERPNVDDDVVGISFLPGFGLVVSEIFEE